MSVTTSVWIGVVGGSTLRVSVNGKTKDDIDFTSNARVVPTKGAERLVPDHRLNPGPYELETKDGVTYAVRVAVKFLSESLQRAIVTAQLRGPDGKIVPNVEGEAEYECELAGKQGQPIRRCTLVLQRFSAGNGS